MHLIEHQFEPFVIGFEREKPYISLADELAHVWYLYVIAVNHLRNLFVTVFKPGHFGSKRTGRLLELLQYVLWVCVEKSVNFGFRHFICFHVFDFRCHIILHYTEMIFEILDLCLLVLSDVLERLPVPIKIILHLLLIDRQLNKFVLHISRPFLCKRQLADLLPCPLQIQRVFASLLVTSLLFVFQVSCEVTDEVVDLWPHVEVD